MATKTYPFDPAELLDTPAAQAAYLSAILADGNADEVRYAIGVVARARGMNEIARNAGMGVSGLYKALSPKGNPGFTTMLRVIEALNLKVQIAPAELPARKRARTAASSKAVA